MASDSGLGATLIDSLQTTLISAAEIGGNRLLGFDDEALARCAELQGHCVAIEITDLEFKLYCHPGSWGIRLSRNPPAREVDARISGRLMALVNLAAEDDKVSSSIQGRVSFHGNVALAQKLQRIIADLDLDWEEILAHSLGDVLAFQIGERLRQARSWLQQSGDSITRTSSEFMREEARISPTQVEFDRFQANLTELKHDVARAEARLQQLLDTLAT